MTITSSPQGTGPVLVQKPCIQHHKVIPHLLHHIAASTGTTCNYGQNPQKTLFYVQPHGFLQPNSSSVVSIPEFRGSSGTLCKHLPGRMVLRKKSARGIVRKSTWLPWKWKRRLYKQVYASGTSGSRPYTSHRNSIIPSHLLARIPPWRHLHACLWSLERWRSVNKVCIKPLHNKTVIIMIRN